MPVDAGVRVAGARELRRTLKAAGDDLADLKSAHKAAGDIVVRRADSTAPRVSGRLERSTRAGAAAGSATIRAGGRKVPYANPIHWGWPRRHITAQPWISAAAKDTEPEWLRLYQAAVDKIINTIRGI